jgi:hypothetical protein
MGPTGCPETSVRNYHYSLRNSSEEPISHLTAIFDHILEIQILHIARQLRVHTCVCFHGRLRQATGVLQPAGLLYRPLWAFQLLPPDAPAPTDAFRTLAAQVGTYGRE